MSNPIVFGPLTFIPKGKYLPTVLEKTFAKRKNGIKLEIEHELKGNNVKLNITFGKKQLTIVNSSKYHMGYIIIHDDIIVVSYKRYGYYALSHVVADSLARALELAIPKTKL